MEVDQEEGRDAPERPMGMKRELEMTYLCNVRLIQLNRDLQKD